MEKILFSNEVIYDGEVSVIGSNQIRITFNDNKPAKKVLSEGFKLLNEHNLFVQRDCSDYTTIYRTYTDDTKMIEFSNNGSVYVPTEPIPTPESEPIILSFDELRRIKISELSSICNMKITDGVSVNGEAFSYNTIDQINIKELFDTVIVTGLPISYHANGEICRDFTAEEIVNIYVKLMVNKFENETYFNQAKHFLLSLEENDVNKEIIENFTYGDALVGEYLDGYNQRMLTLQAQIDAILNK